MRFFAWGIFELNHSKKFPGIDCTWIIILIYHIFRRVVKRHVVDSVSTHDVVWFTAQILVKSFFKNCHFLLSDSLVSSKSFNVSLSKVQNFHSIKNISVEEPHLRFIHGTPKEASNCKRNKIICIIYFAFKIFLGKFLCSLKMCNNHNKEISFSTGWVIV